MSGIQEQFSEYLLLNKELQNRRKELKEFKKRSDDLEHRIKEYMTLNQMDSISLKEGEIVLYPKKISQTFKKEIMIEKLTEKLNDSKKAEELTDSILQNKQFILQDKLRAVLKKK